MTDDEFQEYSWADMVSQFVGAPPFKLKQYGGGPHEEAVQQLQCKGCGGVRFHVGKADYYTAIRCANCGWERCVHDG